MDKMPKCYQPYCPANTDCANEIDCETAISGYSWKAEKCVTCDWKTEKKNP